MSNRRGVTLVEILVAMALFILIVSCFNYLLKVSAKHTNFANDLSRKLFGLRATMEEIRCTPFEKLPLLNSEKVRVFQVASDLILIQAESFFTLRSKYQ